jgi:hypothetical protein
MKFVYKTELFKLESGWFNFSGKSEPTYIDLVNERGADGWRLVSAFVPPMGGEGYGRWLHLIFERAADDET